MNSIKAKLMNLLCGSANLKQEEQSNSSNVYVAPVNNHSSVPPHAEAGQSNRLPQTPDSKFKPNITINNGVMTMTMYVPAKFHGKIIGKGGATIKCLQDEYNVKISIPERNSSDERINVVGLQENVPKAVQAIGQTIGFRDYHQPAQMNNNISANVNGYVAHTVNNITSPASSCTTNQVLFFPDSIGSGAFGKFLSNLGSAKQSCDIAVYTISDDRVVRVIERLHSNGVKIRIITEADTLKDQGNDVESLARMGIDCKADASPALMHHKFAIIDGQLLISGSFNWTRSAATANQENMVVSNIPSLVQQFAQEFERMWNLQQMQTVHGR